MSRSYLIFVLVAVLLSCNIYTNNVVHAESKAGAPLKFTSGCRIDLNGDKRNDTVLMIENGASNSNELIVLISDGDGYKTYVLKRGDFNMYLSCNHGEKLLETKSGDGNKSPRVHQTNGAYIELIQPESSSVAYYWKERDFVEVWLSD